MMSTIESTFTDDLLHVWNVAIEMLSYNSLGRALNRISYRKRTKWFKIEKTLDTGLWSPRLGIREANVLIDCPLRWGRESLCSSCCM